MRAKLIKTFRIEAAHRTRCEGCPDRLHGHSFEIDLVLSGECDSDLGWLVDYGEISESFGDTFDALDHQLLNDVEGLADPSVQGLERWIHGEMSPRIPLLEAVQVRIIGALEFGTSRLDADPRLDLPARLRFGFEGAHSLPRLPATHKCSRMHGHSFTVDVGCRELEKVTPHLEEVYNRLDHQCLNEQAGLENPTSEELARWIWNRLDEAHAAPSVVVVAETCTARCIYHGQ